MKMVDKIFEEKKNVVGSNVSEFLTKLSVKYFGKRIFAYANYECECHKGLAVFESKNNELIGVIPLEEKK